MGITRKNKMMDDFFMSFYPMDESFTKIRDSLGSHLRVPYLRKAPVEGLFTLHVKRG
jgi:hypothetical protein